MLILFWTVLICWLVIGYWLVRDRHYYWQDPGTAMERDENLTGLLVLLTSWSVLSILLVAIAGKVF